MLSDSMTRSIKTRKERKRKRYNIILNVLREPMTLKYLEAHMNAKNTLYSALAELRRGGFVICVGTNDEGKNCVRLWQAVSFDFRENGMTYDDDDTGDAPSLADKIYKHDPDKMAQKYKDTAAYDRKLRKSARVYVGCSSFD